VREDARQEEARAALERVARDSDTIAGSSLGRAGRRLGDHFSGKDPDDAAGRADPIEVWGRRIGRALSLLGVIVLTYLLGVQLRFW
jgi:hypothetical protein